MTGAYLVHDDVRNNDSDAVVEMTTTHLNTQKHHHRNTTKRNTFYILNYDNFSNRQFRNAHGGRFRLHGTETRDSCLPERFGPIANKCPVRPEALKKNPQFQIVHGPKRVMELPETVFVLHIVCPMSKMCYFYPLNF